MDLNECILCPRKCKVNRNNGEVGFCKAGNKIKIARYSLHMCEEPCISGEKGSGTIFFSCCNLKCIFCQNHNISINNNGKEITIDKFVEICLKLQEMGANNINLVTPTMYIPLIKEGLIIAKGKGLSIPIVYNSSGYESVEALKELDGLIDIYLPDFKYFDNKLAVDFSIADNYCSIAKDALKEMYRQVNKPIFKDDIMVKGMIVRHLLLPNHIDDSKKIIEYLYDTYKDNIYLSIMNQYTPVLKIEKFKELNKTVSNDEYDELIDYACDLGISKAFIQEGETCKESFIPDFNNYENI